MNDQEIFEENLKEIIGAIDSGLVFFFDEEDVSLSNAKIDYDERNVGTDATITLKVKINDIYKERRTKEELGDDMRFDAAMEALRNG